MFLENSWEDGWRYHFLQKVANKPAKVTNVSNRNLICVSTVITSIQIKEKKWKIGRLTVGIGLQQLMSVDLCLAEEKEKTGKNEMC